MSKNNVVFIWNWFSLSKKGKVQYNGFKILSIKQLLENSTGQKFDKFSDSFSMFDENDQDVIEIKKLIEEMKTQRAVIGSISNSYLIKYDELIQNLCERIGSLFLSEQKNNKKIIDTYSNDYETYTHILLNSGIEYQDRQLTGRANSSFLRKNKQERIESLKKTGYKILDIDFKACQPSLLNSFLEIFPEEDFYLGFAKSLGIERSEAKDLALKKYIWGPQKHESLNKLYEWRSEFYQRAINNNGAYTLAGGKNIFVDSDTDEQIWLNRYCQAIEAQLIHDIANQTLKLFKNKASYLAAIVHDELIFCIEEDEFDSIKEKINNVIKNVTKEKLVWTGDVYE